MTAKSSAHLNALRGNPGKRRAREFVNPSPGIPDTPEWLDGRALDEWNRLIPILDSMGVLSPADGNALAAYCVSCATYVEAVAILREKGVLVEGSPRAPGQEPRSSNCEGFPRPNG
ncbi:P27 family phage terminase small subunit [Yinghuangia aomiensis]